LSEFVKLFSLTEQCKGKHYLSNIQIFMLSENDRPTINF